MKNKKREYVSEKEYVLYLPQGSVASNGFVKELIGTDGKSTPSLVPLIADATRLTSVEANRIAVDFQKKDGRYPFKLKICDYKDLKF